MAYKILALAASAATLGFGVWHLFVPGLWKWYNYMDPKATELVLAVRATNFFFSLSLILLGLLNILLLSSGQTSRHTLVVLLGADILLWLCRVVMQLAWPQGSLYPAVQYGMLAGFCLVLALYTAALVLLPRAI